MRKQTQLITWRFSVSLSHSCPTMWYAGRLSVRGPTPGEWWCRVFSEIMGGVWAECRKSQEGQGAVPMAQGRESEQVRLRREKGTGAKASRRSLALWLRSCPPEVALRTKEWMDTPAAPFSCPPDCLSDSLCLHPAWSQRHLWSCSPDSQGEEDAGKRLERPNAAKTLQCGPCTSARLSSGRQV